MFKPGQSGNLNGRPKGVPNKSTTDLRKLFRAFLSANMDTVQSDFDKLEPKDRLSFIERVAKLVLPPPFAPERLTEEQVEQVINHIKSNSHEQISKN